MNERIRELAEQAGCDYLYDYSEDGGHAMVCNEYNIEKFAHLIVRECAKFLEDNSGYDDCNNAWHPEPEDLLKHFGVEDQTENVTNKLSLQTANIIADQFSPGFFDDNMVQHVAEIIRENIVKQIVQECIKVMSNTDKTERATYMGDEVPTAAHQYELRKHFGIK